MQRSQVELRDELHLGFNGVPLVSRQRSRAAVVATTQRVVLRDGRTGSRCAARTRTNDSRQPRQHR